MISWRSLHAATLSFICLIELSVTERAVAADFINEAPLEIAIIADAIAIDAKSSDASTTIIDANGIRASGATTVAEVLRATPGLMTIASGGPGQTTSVQIRGLRSEDVLVLIDGIEANDAASIGRAYDFASLDVENIERIEILRGPQSVRYGSGAIGGVINVITKRGTGSPAGEILVEGGSFDTMRAGASVRGAKGAFDWSLGASALQTHGFSAADEADGNSEKDGAERVGLSARAGFKLSSTARIEAVARRQSLRADLDRRGGPGGDDPNYQAWTSQFLSGVTASDRHFNGRLLSSLAYSFAEISRRDSNLPDALSADVAEDSFIGETQKLDFSHSLLLTESQTLHFGVQRKQESAAAVSSGSSAGFAYSSVFQRQTESDYGESVEYSYDDGTMIANLGGRLAQGSRFGAADAEKASIGARLPGALTARSTYATGFKAPSLYQLYSKSGEPTLTAERDESYELSLERPFTVGVRTSVAWFYTRSYGLIDYNSATNKFAALGDAISSGWELQANADLTAGISAAANLTLLDARIASTGARLLRRPDSMASLEAKWHRGPLEITVSYRYVGARDDTDPVVYNRRLALESHDLLGARLAWTISERWLASLRMENLFDRRYQEVAGYGTAHISGYAALLARF